MLDQILSLNIFAFFIVFVRLSAAMLILPVLGEQVIPVRVRLFITLAVTVSTFPLVGDRIPEMPDTVGELFGMMMMEFVIGLLIGSAARVIMGALHTAGTVISFASSLGFAQTVDPTARIQGTVVVGLLNVMGLTIIFASGLHYMVLQALVDSYTLFPINVMPPIGDFADLILRLVSRSFRVGYQLATPFVVYSLIFYISLGVLGRLMPRVQLFFIMMPLQILMSMTILMILLPAILIWFLGYFESTFSEFLVPR